MTFKVGKTYDGLYRYCMEQLQSIANTMDLETLWWIFRGLDLREVDFSKETPKPSTDPKSAYAAIRELARYIPVTDEESDEEDGLSFVVHRLVRNSYSDSGMTIAQALEQGESALQARFKENKSLEDQAAAGDKKTQSTVGGTADFDFEPSSDVFKQLEKLRSWKRSPAANALIQGMEKLMPLIFLRNRLGTVFSSECSGYYELIYRDLPRPPNSTLEM